MEKTHIIENRKGIHSINNHFNNLQWLLKIRPKDNGGRGYLSCLHIEDGIYFITDDYRLHMYCPDFEELPTDFEIPDGNYEIITNNKNQVILRETKDIEYPNIWQSLTYKRINGIPSFVSSLTGHKDSDEYTWSNFVRHIYKNTDKNFQIAYLKDSFMEGNLSFEIAGDKPLAPIVFGNVEKIAVIMPFKD